MRENNVPYVWESRTLQHARNARMFGIKQWREKVSCNVFHSFNTLNFLAIDQHVSLL